MSESSSWTRWGCSLGQGKRNFSDRMNVGRIISVSSCNIFCFLQPGRSNSHGGTQSKEAVLLLGECFVFLSRFGWPESWTIILTVRESSRTAHMSSWQSQRSGTLPGQVYRACSLILCLGQQQKQKLFWASTWAFSAAPLLASTSVEAGIQRAPPFRVCSVSIYGPSAYACTQTLFKPANTACLYTSCGSKCHKFMPAVWRGTAICFKLIFY